MPSESQPTPCPGCGRADTVRPKLHAIPVEGPVRFATGFFCDACQVGFLSQEWMDDYEVLRDFGPKTYRELKRSSEQPGGRPDVSNEVA